MNRMWDKNDIIKLIEEYAPGFDPSEIPEGVIDAILGLNADGEAVKGNLDGKYVKVIAPPAGTTLTDEELEDILDGCFVNGSFLGGANPVFFPGGEVDGYYQGIVTFQFGGRELQWRIYKIDVATKVITAPTELLTFNTYFNALEFYGTRFPPAPFNPSVQQHLVGTKTLYSELKWAPDPVVNLAPFYDENTTYSVGDLVIYNGLLYQCNTAITTPENWTGGHWTRKTIAELLEAL